jgi:hypothetical protein
MVPHESAVMATGAGAAMTEACHVPLDRRGTPRTCYLVADKFGFANCQTVASPALGDTQEGRAAASGGTAAAQSSPAFRRQSAKAAAAGRNNAVTAPRRLRTSRNTDRRYAFQVVFCPAMVRCGTSSRISTRPNSISCAKCCLLIIQLRLVAMSFILDFLAERLQRGVFRNLRASSSKIGPLRGC